MTPQPLPEEKSKESFIDPFVFKVYVDGQQVVTRSRALTALTEFADQEVRKAMNSEIKMNGVTSPSLDRLTKDFAIALKAIKNNADPKLVRESELASLKDLLEDQTAQKEDWITNAAQLREELAALKESSWGELNVCHNEYKELLEKYTTLKSNTSKGGMNPPMQNGSEITPEYIIQQITIDANNGVHFNPDLYFGMINRLVKYVANKPESGEAGQQGWPTEEEIENGWTDYMGYSDSKSIWKAAIQWLKKRIG